MFEDLINRPKEGCPSCGSLFFEYVTGEGHFLSKDKFKQRVECTYCGYKWWVVLNDKLEIIGE